MVWIQLVYKPALALGRVLGHVGGRAAVLAAERQALQQTQRDENDRRGDADGGVARQHADERGRCAHDDDGDQEGVLAPDEVAEPAEHQRAERPHEEAGGERQQREDVGGGVVDAGEELLGDDRRERAVEIEVVPLEHRAERGRENHATVRSIDAAGARLRHRAGTAGHEVSPEPENSNEFLERILRDRLQPVHRPLAPLSISLSAKRSSTPRSSFAAGE